MDPEKTEAGDAKEVLDEVAGLLEPIGLQEETELPAQILEEFVRNSRKKDKLLCSQLQVVDFLQNFLAQEDTAQGPDTLVSEDTSRKKANEAKEQWKVLKAKYQDHVEAIRYALIQALSQIEETQKKYSELQEAYKQVHAKKDVIAEKLQTAQKQWELHQKRIQSLTEITKEMKKGQAKDQQKLDQSNQELETLKQEAGQEQDKLERTQTYLQLLSTLQGKPVDPEGKPVDPEGKPVDLEAKAKDNDVMGKALPPKSL